MASLDSLSAAPATGRSTRPGVLKRLIKNRAALIGGSLVLIFVLMALLAPILPLADPFKSNFLAIRKPPSELYWFGTDELGRDQVTRLFFGARASLLAGIVSVLIALAIGIPFGLIAGWYGGWIDIVISRFTEAMLACPFLILAIAFAAVLGPSLTNAMIAIGLSAVPIFIRLVRGQVMSVKAEDFVEGARAVGARDLRLMFRHVLPNTLSPIVVQSTLFMAQAIILEAALSFLGLGQQPPAPSWGQMLNVAKNFMEQAPWMSVAPGVCIFLAVLGFNLLGDGLRDALDPKRKLGFKDMSMFTTRPEILGTFGVVTSTHWLATAAGMAMLEKGGNAFDACAAAAFVLQVVEPHLVGPAGDMPAVFYSAETKKVEVLCAQGPAPQAATIQAYKDLGLDLIPGSGLLATVVPGAFGGWMTLLRDHGRLKLREVLEPAIGYFENGHPMLPRVSDSIRELTDLFTGEWPTSGAVYLPGGNVPEARKLFANKAAASTYRRILDEAEAAGADRQEQIQGAYDAWYKGFVAEAMDRFCRTQEVMDSSGHRHKGLLTADDMARWQPSYEAPASVRYHDWEVHKIGPWGQGPVFLQTLKILEGIDLAGMGPASPEFVHHVTEAMKLAFADREAYYGDPDFVDVPLAALLSDDYAAGRRSLIGEQASLELRPGTIPGYEQQVARALKALGAVQQPGSVSAAVGEPTMASMVAAGRKGDTVHIDVIDKWGNMIAATPSGGWLQSSPVIPELGFPLNSRAQMFWLEEGLPASLAPGKRPRTTLTPTLAFENGQPRLAFGTPGGDQQEQWQLGLFLRRVHHGLNLQEAIDLPLFHTQHFPSSFYPRASRPGHLMVEESIGAAALAELERRGHLVERAPAWTVGRLTAAERGDDGILRAAATPRLMQAYAAGR